MSNKQKDTVSRSVTFRRMCVSVSPHTAISFVQDIRNLIPWNNGINKGRRYLEVRYEHFQQHERKLNFLFIVHPTLY